MAPKLTEAQRRALAWLPADWSSIYANRSMSSALNSLALYHSNLVWRSGGRRHAYRLRPAGAALKKELGL